MKNNLPVIEHINISKLNLKTASGENQIFNLVHIVFLYDTEHIMNKTSSQRHC